MYRIYLSLVSVFLCVLSVSAQEAQPKIYRYSTPTYVRNELVSINHYRFDDRMLKMRSLDEYSSYESEQGDFIRLDAVGDMACSIIFRFTPLNVIPKDEVEAKKLYNEELSKVSTLKVRGTKTDSRLKPNVGNFPQSFLLISDQDGPIKEICTFFIQTPYLYTVIIGSQERIAGKHISDCSKMLKSLSIEVLAKQPPSSTTEATSENVPPAILSEEQKSSAISKMISDAFGSTTTEAAERSDRRMGSGDGTSPIEGTISSENNSGSADH